MKRLIKTLFASALAVSLSVSSINAFASATPAKDPFALTPQADILAKIPKGEPKGQIIYGSTTQVNGDFMSGWSNAGTNQDIKTLIYGGYSIAEYTKDDGFVVNPIAVKKWSTKVNDDKSKTYTFEIYDNLTYNNKSKITADDYIFDILLGSSPEFKALETTTAGGEIFVGYEDFNSGKTKTFSGIRKLSNYSFSVTVKAEELPNYYELAMVSSGPMPLAVIAPGVKLTDDGKGATLSKEFTTDLLKKTILDEKTGYRFNPKVTPGPYQFDSFDVANSIVTVTLNPEFKGNLDGTKPQIQKLIIKRVETATMMAELETGAVDLLAGIGDGLNIEKGLDLVDAKKASYIDYPRAGYGKITFHCDWGPTQYVAVRQAVAWCLDRDEFCRTFTKGYGIVVHGYYGASQWEYVQNKDLLEKTLVNYNYNLTKAKNLLIQDGWIYDKDGKAYVEKAGNIRYKKVDGELMPLVIEWCGSEKNDVTTLINTMLPKEAEKIGMKINLTEVDFATLQAHVGRSGIEKPIYNMFNLATGFSTATSPWYYFSTDTQYLGKGYNNNFILNESLDAVVQAMKTTDSTDKEGWSEKWVDFQVQWNQLVPDIPLYSNQYHDFFNLKLENFNTTPMWSYRYAIQRANVK